MEYGLVFHGTSIGKYYCKNMKYRTNIYTPHSAYSASDFLFIVILFNYFWAITNRFLFGSKYPHLKSFILPTPSIKPKPTRDSHYASRDFVIGRAKRAPHWGVQSRFRVIYVCIYVYMLSVRRSMSVVCQINCVGGITWPTRMLKVFFGGG